jgi:hypothetical protein
VVKMSVVIFWVVMPCNLVGGYQHSSKMLSQHTRLHSVTIHGDHYQQCGCQIEVYLSTLAVYYTLYKDALKFVHVSMPVTVPLYTSIS